MSARAGGRRRRPAAHALRALGAVTLGLAALAGVAAPGRAAAGAAPDSARPLAPDVHYLPGRLEPGAQPDGNTVIFDAPDGLIVVDTGRRRDHAEAILEFAARAGRPLAAVVNTHWHLDHVGGNARLRERHPGLIVYASGALEQAMTGFLADYRRYLETAVADTAADSASVASFREELAILDAGPELSPDEVVAAGAGRTIAGRRLVLGYAAHAVTAADLLVFDLASRVLAAGDLVTLPVPLFDTACPEGWRNALGLVASMKFDLLVPGHGPPLTRAQFDAWRRAFDNLLACADGQSPAEECIAGWLRDAGDLVPHDEHAAARTLLAHYLDRNLRGDPARRAALCGK